MRAGYRLQLLLSRSEIAEGVRRLAAEIRKDYRDKNPVLIGVLRGGFVFLADLVRELDIPLSVDFAGVESYRGTESSGRVRVTHGVGLPIRGKDVLVVEDIVDTGRTTSHLLKYLRSKGPASLKLCVLLDKPSRREVEVHIDYLGFTVPDRFLVGYGLDIDQEHRHHPVIYVLDEGG
jgi:hypoxanthine phosphoribosyltransferase